MARSKDRHEAVKANASPGNFAQNAPAALGNVPQGRLRQWSTQDGSRFFPVGKTQASLVPGLYDIRSCDQGIYFERLSLQTEGLIRFPHTNADMVLAEIQAFWQREPLFRQYGLAFQRGILLWGPPGSGKTSVLSLLMQDVIARGGVVIKFDSPGLFTEGIRRFRQVQPTTPLIVLMEDLDSTLDHHAETDVLNILDGVDRVDKCVFLATTNYPEKLGPRIVNRPSRFDKRFKIGHPTSDSRLLYFRHLLGDSCSLDFDIVDAVNDTDGFSLAHLKELFVAVVILGDDYARALGTLKSMSGTVSSDGDDGSALGFRNGHTAGYTHKALGALR